MITAKLEFFTVLTGGLSHMYEACIRSFFIYHI